MRPGSMSVVLTFCLLASAVRASAGRLDLDIYARMPRPAAARAAEFPRELLRFPGDPRALRGESPWVRRVSHAGFTAMGLAGLAGSIASGGVAPAVGFGLIALVQGWQLLFDRDAPARKS